MLLLNALQTLSSTNFTLLEHKDISIFLLQIILPDIMEYITISDNLLFINDTKSHLENDCLYLYKIIKNNQPMITVDSLKT